MVCGKLVKVMVELDTEGKIIYFGLKTLSSDENSHNKLEGGAYIAYACSYVYFSRKP